MDQMHLMENADSLFHSLENFTQNEGIIGKPVVQGDKTFLPIVSISVGYGGGNAASKGQTGNNMTAAGMNAGGAGSGALGFGAKVTTDAVILIDNNNVSMLPMNGNTSTLVDKLPQILSGMNLGKNQGQGQNQGQNQAAGGGQNNLMN